MYTDRYFFEFFRSAILILFIIGAYITLFAKSFKTGDQFKLFLIFCLALVIGGAVWGGTFKLAELPFGGPKPDSSILERRVYSERQFAENLEEYAKSMDPVPTPVRVLIWIVTPVFGLFTFLLIFMPVLARTDTQPSSESDCESPPGKDW